jgi:hypothetical protein
MLKKAILKTAGMGLLASGAFAAAAGVRYYTGRKINAAQKFGQALLDTERLEQAKSYIAQEPEAALAACAAYLINTVFLAVEGMTGPPHLDPIGYERKVLSSDGSHYAIITTTVHSPEARWRFELEIPNIAQVSGSRRLGQAKLIGSRIRMETPDTVTIRFVEGYAVNIETNLAFSGSLNPLAGKDAQLVGSASLSDNRGNVGRFSIHEEGAISGSVTCGDRTVGRFTGSLQSGLTFRQSSMSTADK